MPCTQLALDNPSTVSGDLSNGSLGTLKILPGAAAMICTVTGNSGSHLAVETEVPVRREALVQIEWDGRVWLGEVIEVTEQRCTIRLEHSFCAEDVGKFWNSE